jgi:hypothetical protein
MRGIKTSRSRDYYVSQKFQWLPSDFTVAEDGAVTLASPYINNVHPQKHAALESVIPKLLERAVPVVGTRALRRVDPCSPSGQSRRIEVLCLIVYSQRRRPAITWTAMKRPRTDRDAWLSKKDLKLPDAKEKYNGDLDVMKTPTVSLKGTTIQCIIKLANIVLTPEKPEYPGGKWHVEG